MARFSASTRRWIYEYLALRDGEHCLICKAKPKLGRPLEIDHANGITTDNNPENLSLLCKNCNLELRSVTSKKHIAIIKKYYARNVCVCECEKGNKSTSMARELIDYKSGSVEMKANALYEVKFRDWVIDIIKEVGSIRKKDAINGGAELVGCSAMTTSRYLDKLTSLAGNLMEAKDELGQVVIKKKEHKQCLTR